MNRNVNQLAVSVIGAGGKMGSKVSRNLLKKDYCVFLCEKGKAGISRIQERGLKHTATENAVPESDAVVMAVPDTKIGEVSSEIVPIMRKNATLIALDPAAAYVDELAMRDDCTFVVTHPCHPSLFREWETIEERNDLFGCTASKQDIVIALAYGKEENFLIGQRICMDMFAPVVNCHRITVEQMAILEPALTEVVAASAVVMMKEAMEEAIRIGVPREAAEAFMLGHIQVQLAILFGKLSWKFSDAANIAVRIGSKQVLNPDWKDNFRRDVLKKTVHMMLHPDQ